MQDDILISFQKTGKVKPVLWGWGGRASKVFNQKLSIAEKWSREGPANPNGIVWLILYGKGDYVNSLLLIKCLRVIQRSINNGMQINTDDVEKRESNQKEKSQLGKILAE